MAIRQQHLPNNIIMPYNSGQNTCHNNTKSHESNKIAGLTNTVTPSCVGKCLRLTFSSDLEEAMFETGESLSAISKFNSVIEKNQPIYIKSFTFGWESNHMPLTFQVSALTTRPLRPSFQSLSLHPRDL